MDYCCWLLLCLNHCKFKHVYIIYKIKTDFTFTPLFYFPLYRILFQWYCNGIQVEYSVCMMQLQLNNNIYRSAHTLSIRCKRLSLKLYWWVVYTVGEMLKIVMLNCTHNCLMANIGISVSLYICLKEYETNFPKGRSISLNISLFFLSLSSRCVS
jgi:hypothetical protein